jgi:hypothetical protein
MPESKHFFEGYSRSKDMLATLADKITSATIERPWTIKSGGYITSTNNTFNGHPHICLSRELKNGDIMNVLFIDTYNTATNNIYGAIQVYYYAYDGCDVANDKFMFNCRNNHDLQYHSSQVADIDATPQFGWYWMWIDEEGIAMTVFGNVGAAGTATAAYRFAYLGTAFPARENFKESFCWLSNSATESAGQVAGSIFDSVAADYVYPNTAPINWANHSFKSMPKWFADNTSTSNPSALLGGDTFMVSKPELMQSTDTDGGGSSWSHTRPHELSHTHWYGNGQFLFCLPGSVLYRGDIITIDSENADYIFQTVDSNGLGYNYLIKRMESASELLATNEGSQIALTWRNPQKCFGVKIVKKAGEMPTNHTDGTVVFNQTTDTGLLAGQPQNTIDSNMTAGLFFYRAFAYSSNEVYSVPVTSAACEITIE